MSNADFIETKPHKEFTSGQWRWFINYAFLNGDQIVCQWASGATAEEAEKQMQKIRENYKEGE